MPKEATNNKKVIPQVAVNQEEEKTPFETTILWDFSRQSYGKKPKGNNKFQGVTPAFIIK